MSSEVVKWNIKDLAVVDRVPTFYQWVTCAYQGNTRKNLIHNI
ncbi:MAG: hypothetical protein U0T36_05225 [Saprospiraceae bacterium]